MTANHDQAPLSQQLAASTPSRRRPVPPSRSAPMSQSVNQRWRERPRCPASRVTPGRRDGVVHAIVGRAACHVSAQRVRQGETWRPPVCVVGVFLSENQADNHTRAWSRRALILEAPRTHGRTTNVRLHHRVFDSGAVLGIVNALRCASTRPSAGPAGIDDACARHDLGYYAMAGFLMARAKQKVRISVPDNQGGRASTRSTTSPITRAQSPIDSPMGEA
jgi:hypothetical protein